jgi:uncharacterized protein (DUF1778 family)
LARTALLIRCTRLEAERIRLEALKAQNSISQYVLSVALHATASPAKVTEVQRQLDEPRTAILVRCEASDAERIRDAARDRGDYINQFVLRALRDRWHSPHPTSR